MSNNIVPSLVNLPVELVYRILERLNPLTLLTSVRNVCTRLDQIIEDISWLPGKVHNQTRRRQCRSIRWRRSTVSIQYLCWIDITRREFCSFLDNHHAESQERRIRWMASETISWDADKKSGNITTCFSLTLSLPFPMFLSSLENWICRELKWIRKRSNILPRHWRSTRWDDSVNHLLISHRFHAWQTLTELDLGWNKILAVGSRYLSDSLKINRVKRDLLVSTVYSIFELFLDTDQTWAWRKQHRP